VSKASYLNYYGIPAHYTEVTIAEMLNSSWSIIHILQMLLSAGLGIVSIVIHNVVSALSLPKKE
jgi:hypothetical protein